MKILFVSAVFPYPLYSGGQIRIYNILKRVGRRHEVTLATFLRSGEEPQWSHQLPFCRSLITEMRGHAWQARYVMRALSSSYPFVFATYDIAAMRKKLADELARTQYDLVHIEPGYVWPAIPDTNVPLVIAEHNIEHVVYEGYVRRFPVVPLRMVLYADVIKLRMWESRIWKNASGIVTVSDTDADVVRRMSRNKEVHVVPNGVDVDAFAYMPKPPRASDHPVVLFVGNFSWIQNRDAVAYLCNKLWNNIRSVYPGAELRIVGKHMPDSMKGMVLKTGAVLLEEVADIRDQLHHADVLLAPIRVGGGTKFKILEAMASGLPVITTPKGIEGLQVRDGKEIMVATSAHEVTEALKVLFSNHTKRMAITKSARYTIEKLYAWDGISSKLLSIWEHVHERNH